MKKEKMILIITMLLNFLIASIKLVSGIVFQFSSLIADSLHSFSDFITDILSSIANRIGKKRANKKYPFGYGMIENISNLLIGIILFLLAVYIFIESFHSKEIILEPIIFIILVAAIILKLVVVAILYFSGKSLNNNSLLVSAKESAVDLVSSVIVLIVSILLQFQDKISWFKYANTVGSILISIIVFETAIKIIIENIEFLLGKNDENENIKTSIEKIINKNKLIKDSEFSLMKFGNYYNLFLTIELENNLTMKQLFSLEAKIKKEIRNKKLKIKFIEIEPKPYGGD